MLGTGFVRERIYENKVIFVPNEVTKNSGYSIENRIKIVNRCNYINAPV